MLGYCTLGMKGIAEKPRSTRGVLGASVFNKDTLLAPVWEPLVPRRREAEDGRRPTFHWPHGWSPGQAVVTLSSAKTFLGQAWNQWALLRLIPKIFFNYYLQRN